MSVRSSTALNVLSEVTGLGINPVTHLARRMSDFSPRLWPKPGRGNRDVCVDLPFILNWSIGFIFNNPVKAPLFVDAVLSLERGTGRVGLESDMKEALTHSTRHRSFVLDIKWSDCLSAVLTLPCEQREYHSVSSEFNRRCAWSNHYVINGYCSEWAILTECIRAAAA